MVKYLYFRNLMLKHEFGNTVLLFSTFNIPFYSLILLVHIYCTDTYFIVSLYSFNCKYGTYYCFAIIHTKIALLLPLSRLVIITNDFYSCDITFIRLTLTRNCNVLIEDYSYKMRAYQILYEGSQQFRFQ